MAGHDVPDDILMAHALLNTGSQLNTNTDAYKVSYGSKFVNEYARIDKNTGRRFDGGVDDPNHLLATFPVLFPYGLGGFEVDRPVKLTYEEHARWALQYSDRRFRLDPHFPFQIFGVLQKRRICSSARLQMNKSSFNKSKLLLSKLKAKDFEKAALEQARNQSFTNPAMAALKKQVSAVRSRVPGTDEARRSLRAKINGTTAMKGPPSLWLTINPADSTNPISQVLD